MKNGTLYLFPVTLGDNTTISQVIPEYNSILLSSITHFIVENIREARRFIRKSCPEKNIDDIQFFEINKRQSTIDYNDYLLPIYRGENIGLLSDAGCPAIADPGSEIVSIAQSNDIQVVPLVGPSSIYLSLMASGMSGQNFEFHGYLPKNQSDRINKIKALEFESKKKDKTQLFIETPYRNMHLFEDLIKTCNAHSKLCIAKNVSLPNEIIKTKSISEWKNSKIDLQKVPCIFLIKG